MLYHRKTSILNEWNDVHEGLNEQDKKMKVILDKNNPLADIISAVYIKVFDVGCGRGDPISILTIVLEVTDYQQNHCIIIVIGGEKETLYTTVKISTLYAAYIWQSWEIL